MIALFVVGCGNNGENNTKNNTEKENDKSNVASVKTDEPKKPKLSEDEQLALDYVNVYLNGTDTAKKAEFIQNNLHKDVQEVFQIGAGVVTAPEDMLNNPEVVKSKEITNEGVKQKIVLLSATDANNKPVEIIVLYHEGKIAWSYQSNDEDESKDAFDGMRNRFN